MRWSKRGLVYVPAGNSWWTKNRYAFNPTVDEVQDLKARYVKGKVGDVEVKQKLSVALNQVLDPMRERRAEFERQPGLLEDILADGSYHARQEARETLGRAREAMGLNYFSRARQHVDALIGAAG